MSAISPAHTLPARLSAAALLAASTATAQSVVWVVDDDGGPGVDFTEVQAAVDAAADGDTILVKEGLYADVQVTDKALVLAADVDATPDVPVITLSNLAATRTLALRGFHTDELRVDQCQGPVWIEGHDSTGGDPAATVTGSDNVVLVHSAFRGSSGVYAGTPPFGSPTTLYPTGGMSVLDSTVHMFDVTVAGGSGGSGNEIHKNGQWGAAGFGATDSVLYLSGTVCAGGSGGYGYSAVLLDPFGSDSCGTGGWGGTGASLVGTTDLVHRDSTFAGGFGGFGGSVIQWGTSGPTTISECADGGSGTDLSAAGTTSSDEIPRPHRSFGINSPARENELLTLTFEGEPGDLAFLFLSLTTDPHVNLPCGGSILFGLSSFLAVATTPVDAMGEATLTVPVPAFGPMSALHFFLQANFVDTNGECNVSTGTVLTLLDATL